MEGGELACSAYQALVFSSSATRGFLAYMLVGRPQPPRGTTWGFFLPCVQAAQKRGS